MITRRAQLGLMGLLLFLGGCTSTLAADAPASPWDLTKLDKPPAVTWLDEKSPIRSLLYVGEPYHGKPTHVFAYYATPGTLASDTSKDKNLPAIVLIHGGGGTAFKDWTEVWAKRGYAAIAMDLGGDQPIEGKDPNLARNRTHLADGGPDQSDETKFGAMDQPVTENWPYHAVANSILAHSLIRTMPGVDPQRTAVTGISWGGYTTCIVASVDHRFKAAVPVYGCGFLHESSCWKPTSFAKMKPADRDRWVKLYDPSSYLAQCTTPIFFINGTNDGAYYLDSYMKSYDLVKCEKNIRITVNMPHSHIDGWAPKEIGVFVDGQCLTGPRGRLTHISPATRNDANEVSAIYAYRRMDQEKATLHYTTDTRDFSKRKWKQRDATHGFPRSATVGIGAKLPADATAWFFTVTDANGMTVSSPVEFKRP